MLVAKSNYGKLLCLGDNFTKEDLILIRKEEQFRCPSCDQPVILKFGDIRIPHFAHKQKNNCHAFSENESLYHLQGKLQFYHWLKKQSLHTILEPYIPTIKQRPDLFYTKDQKNYVLEFQCSSISQEAFISRTTNYEKAGYHPIWIIGGKRFKRISSNRVSLSPFDWLFTTLINQVPSIIFYCSDMRKLILLRDIMSISPQTAIATIKTLPVHAITIHQLLHPINNHVNFDKEWLQLKYKWRLSCTQFPSTSLKKLLRFLYTERIYPSLFPSEIGIPVPSMYWIETSPIIWQSWIVLDFIKPLRTNQIFTIQSVHQYFNSKIKNKFISIRELPLIKETNYSQALLEYLHQLSKIGVLRKHNNETFQKIKKITFPTSVHEASELDKKIMDRVRKNSLSV